MNLFRKHIYLILLFALFACKKDFIAFIIHPGTEQRVKESISEPLNYPEGISIDTMNFKFALFSDIHITEENINLLDRFKEDVTKLGIDFFLVIGDITDNGLKVEFNLSKADLQEVGIPYYVAIGNHDLYQTNAWDLWKETYGPSCYSVSFSDYLKIIFLDSASGLIGKTQFNWLENELKNSPGFTCLASHFAIYNGVTPSIWRLTSADERYKLISLMRDYKVNAFYSGHYHAFTHTEFSGIDHFIVGSMFPHSLDEGGHAYLLVSVDNGNISWEKIDVD